VADNLFTDVPASLAAERFDVLIDTPALRAERIVSTGHATPPGEWYDQERDEWVVVLRGSAGLRFEDEAEPRVMRSGDHVLIPAHRRHRVEWTDAQEPTVWLALHYSSGVVAP
jgi:cupin 2 domain-containing protein